jgi:hypothetical protein
MERTNHAPTTEPRTDGKIRFRKEGRGVFRHRGHIYRPGEIFWAHPSEISMQFRDMIKPVDPAELPVDGLVDVKEELVIKPAYTKVKRETSEFWDIFDGEGKQVNEKALRKEQADEYLESLAK